MTFAFGRLQGRGASLVSQDGDFAEMSLLRGPLPKVIWLRCGNQPAAYVAGLLRRHAAANTAFDLNDALACL